ncbi:MAG: dTDP-4-dehydrorhamnose 3,5-epimerase [Caldimonas sp.]
MKIEATAISGVWEIETAPRADERGSLTRVFCAAAFERVVPGLGFVQVNHSITLQRGTIRGLHFQRPPSAEWKLIRCLRGRVFDVAADLREGSPTFGRWHAVELSEDNQREILIPPGCAHGFQTLAERCELLYQHSEAYAPEREDGVRHDDPRLAIAWPEPVTSLSPRDRGLRLIDAGFESVRA